MNIKIRSVFMCVYIYTHTCTDMLSDLCLSLVSVLPLFILILSDGREKAWIKWYLFKVQKQYPDSSQQFT